MIVKMADQTPKANICYDDQAHCYFCAGDWSILKLDEVLLPPDSLTKIDSNTIAIDGSKMTTFDSSGALALMNIIDDMKGLNKETHLVGFNQQQRALLTLVESKRDAIVFIPPSIQKKSALYRLGKETVNKLEQADGLVILIGDLSSKFFEAIGNWKRFQLPSIASNIYSAGVQALPIVALLSFLIGVVLAYQMGLQLQTYGANIFIAYLSGMAIFREFAPLITAIIVAGRTSSAFTAQIGSMKLNEEIDALYTMGLSPTELLVMPKVFGLLIVFPLLIFWSDVFSIIGAMIMSKSMLHVGYYDFLARLKDSVGLKQLMLGLYKAPVFALLITLVGCFQGFRVQANTNTIGSQTTKSVVQALFLIIVADAAFSIIYSWMGI